MEKRGVEEVGRISWELRVMQELDYVFVGGGNLR